MKQVYLFYILLWLLSQCNGLHAQDAMFRGNAWHNSNHPGFGNMIFNKVAWKFTTGGAIRSTAIVVNGVVYAGSNDGYLYALNSKTGVLLWKYNSGSSISSSPAFSGGLIYFLTEQQDLIALQSNGGKLVWKKHIGEDRPYDWGFDYYFSSPVINGDTLLVATADGKLLSLHKKTGQAFWQYNAAHFIRATPAITGGWVYIGDVNGDMYAIDSKTGAQKWVYHTNGSKLNNDSFGFDRKAIISSAVIEKDIVVFGGRDGYLYAVDRFAGTAKWIMDHKVSWVISSPAVFNNQVITGTSDAAFVQSVDIITGKELWRTPGGGPVWSSPVIAGNYVYVGGNEGVLRCLDVTTGKKAAHPFVANAKIFSSPVIKDSSLYIGADNGVLYCLHLSPVNTQSLNRYVYYDAASGFNFFRNGVDIAVKEYFSRKGYTVIDKSKLLSVVTNNQHTGKGNVIVFASLQLPKEFLVKDSINVLHDFLWSGGIAVGLGNNLLTANHDDKGGFTGFNFKRCQDIIGIPYPENDLRSIGGFFAATATTAGKQMGIKGSWVSNSPVNKTAVNTVLGVDERGRASAWIKNTGSGCFVQLWIDQLFVEDYGFVDEVIENVEWSMVNRQWSISRESGEILARQDKK